MTLATRVHIKYPVNPEKLFLRLLEVLESNPALTLVPRSGLPRCGDATYDHVRKGDVAFHHAVTGKPVLHERSEYRSTIGQGLSAILEVEYGDDGPVDWLARYRDDDEEVGPWDTFIVAARFDTSYGYRSQSGARCDDVHAMLVLVVARFLADAGVPDDAWHWHDEYRGEWKPLEELMTLGDALLAAQDFPVSGLTS